MNKADLIEKISKDSDLSKTAAEKVLNSVFEGISCALQNGDSFSMLGFGSFSISERAARKGRNPRTGQEIQIPSKKVVKFKAGKGLNEKI